MINDNENDDCIYKILEWLPLNDVCFCSQACKRLQALCENHFRRKYPNLANQEFRVNVLRNANLYVYSWANYVKYFRNFIKNIIIYPWSLDENKELALCRVANFIKTNSAVGTILYENTEISAERRSC